jgi:hypothetical protein
LVFFTASPFKEGVKDVPGRDDAGMGPLEAWTTRRSSHRRLRAAMSSDKERIERYAVAHDELLELSMVAVPIALDPVAVVRIARPRLDPPSPQKDAVTKQDGDQTEAGRVSVAS